MGASRRSFRPWIETLERRDVPALVEAAPTVEAVPTTDIPAVQPAAIAVPPELQPFDTLIDVTSKLARRGDLTSLLDKNGIHDQETKDLIGNAQQRSIDFEQKARRLFGV